MPGGNEVYAADRRRWRSWLRQNHARLDEAWLVYYKKQTGKATVSYRDSVEEALCFGWIDGLRHSIDAERYAIRFTPRRQGSMWSLLNIELAEKMIDAGQMTAAGLVVFERRQGYDWKVLKASASREIPLTPEIEIFLKRHKRAWKNFNSLAPSYRKQYAAWLRSAKRQETLHRRLKEAVKLLAANEKLGMK